MRTSDYLLSFFGLQRLRAEPGKRYANAYTGASINRLTLDWVRAPLSADREIQGDLERLRARARDLVRNNAFARRFISMAQNHIAGPYGITLQARNMATSGRKAGRLNEKLNAAIEKAWYEWGKPSTCTLSGKLSWPQVQRLIVSAVVQDGEVLVQLVPGASNPWRFALHLIDADQLDVSYDRRSGREGPEIRMGVEMDEFGRPLAYHITKAHPSEIGASRERVRVPADQIIHLALFDTRVNQTRGVPWFAPVMTDLRHLAGYQEAEVVAARFNAQKLGFIVTKDPNGDVVTPGPGQQHTFAGEPGSIEYLDPNQEFQSWDPTHPSGNFTEFTKAVLRAIAAGLGGSYASLANDLREANYSSMRVGRLEEQDTWCALQYWLIEHLHERVFERWLTQAVLAEAVVVPNYDIKRAAAVEWRPRRWASVDPAKDVEAWERGVALGINSRTKVLAGTGDDIEDVFADLEREKALAAEHGITVEGLKNGANGAQGAADADAGDDSGNGSTSDAGSGGRARARLAVVGGSRQAVLGRGDSEP